jgi:hypothetical protein
MVDWRGLTEEEAWGGTPAWRESNRVGECVLAGDTSSR